MQSFGKETIRNYATARVVFRNAAENSKIASIDIYGQIGSDFWEDGIDPLEFKNDLASLAEHDILEIRMHSYGGYIYEGQAIITSLRRHKAEKHIFVDGIAASMASVILMVGDKRYCAKNATIMIHNPQGFAMGDNEKIRSYLKQMDKLKDQLVAEYVEATGLDEAELSTMMDEETYLTAQEALEKGFIDEIGDEIELDTSNHLETNADLSFLNQDDSSGTQKIAANALNKISPIRALIKLSGTTETIQENAMDPNQNSGENAGQNNLSTEQAAEIAANATAAENKRSSGIRNLSQPGVESLVEQCIADTTCTIGDAAEKIALQLKANNSAAQAASLEARQNESNDSVSNEADEHNISDGENVIAADDYEAQFTANVDGCADEFSSAAHYKAYKEGLKTGNIKHTSNLADKKG